MDHRVMAPFSVRARRMASWIAPGLVVLVGVTGCGHRRTAMRPVYASPVPSSSSSVIVTPSGPSSTITTEPDSSEPFLAPNASVPPTTRSEPVIRAGGGSPPVPNAADEPPLLDQPAPNLAPTAPGTGGIELMRPSALRSTSKRISVPRVSLSDAVRPYVQDPNDLFQPPKADRPWKYVVVHHSANATGGYDQIDRDHRKVLGFEGCGYHFVIGNGTDSPDGQIEIAERWLNQKHGVHCRNSRTSDINEYGIGICLVGNLDDAPPTPRQVAAAKALVAYLSEHYQISSDRVGSHNQFTDEPTACPGKNFPAQAIFGTKKVAAR